MLFRNKAMKYKKLFKMNKQIIRKRDQQKQQEANSNFEKDLQYCFIYKHIV